MKKRHGLVWLFAMMVLSLILGACSMVRGDATETLTEVTAPTGQGLAPVEDLQVIIMESLPATAAVMVRGYLPDGCTNIVDTLMQIDEEVGSFKVTLGTHRDPEAMCTMALVPYEEVINLPIVGLPAGTYTVEVNGMTTTFDLAVDNVPCEV